MLPLKTAPRVSGRIVVVDTRMLLVLSRHTSNQFLTTPLFLSALVLLVHGKMLIIRAIILHELSQYAQTSHREGQFDRTP